MRDDGDVPFDREELESVDRALAELRRAAEDGEASWDTRPAEHGYGIKLYQTDTPNELELRATAATGQTVSQGAWLQC